MICNLHYSCIRFDLLTSMENLVNLEPIWFSSNNVGSISTMIYELSMELAVLPCPSESITLIGTIQYKRFHILNFILENHTVENKQRSLLTDRRTGSYWNLYHGMGSFPSAGMKLQPIFCAFCVLNGSRHSTMTIHLIGPLGFWFRFSATRGDLKMSEGGLYFSFI